MARVSYATLLAEVIDLRERCARLEAHASRPRTGKVPSFSDRARAYCAEHQVPSVPHEVVKQWRLELN